MTPYKSIMSHIQGHCTTRFVKFNTNHNSQKCDEADLTSTQGRQSGRRSDTILRSVRGQPGGALGSPHVGKGVRWARAGDGGTSLPLPLRAFMSPASPCKIDKSSGPEPRPGAHLGTKHLDTRLLGWKHGSMCND